MPNRSYMKKIFIILTLAALALCSCGNPGSKEQETQTAPEKRVMTVATRPCKVPYTFPAQLKGKQDINIYPQVDGILEQVFVSEGESVKKGQKMFAINSTSYEAEVENAAAAVNVARANVASHELELNATRDLYESGVVAEHQYKLHLNALDVAKAQLKESEAVLKHARNNLSHAVITAPHDGVVGTINYRHGSLVGSVMTKPLTVVSDNSKVYAYISVNSEVYMDLLREYESKDSLMAAFPDALLIIGDGMEYEHKGHLETVSGIIDELTGSLSMRIAFENPDGILASGGSGTIRLDVDYDAIVIPRSATYELQDKHFVFKVARGADGKYTASSQEVEVYRLDDANYIVDSGLADNDMIVLEGVTKMEDGMEITLKK